MNYKELGKQFIVEVLRVCAAAVVPVALAYFSVISPEVAAALVVAIKAADKATHKAGYKPGIVRF